MRRHVFVKATVVAAISGTVGSSVATLLFALRLSPLRAASVHDEVLKLSGRRCHLLIGLSFGVDQGSSRSHRTRGGDRASPRSSLLLRSLELSISGHHPPFTRREVSLASPLSCSVREAVSVVEWLIDLPGDPQAMQERRELAGHGHHGPFLGVLAAALGDL